MKTSLELIQHANTKITELHDFLKKFREVIKPKISEIEALSFGQAIAELKCIQTNLTRNALLRFPKN